LPRTELADIVNIDEANAANRLRADVTSPIDAFRILDAAYRAATPAREGARESADATACGCTPPHQRCRRKK